MEYFIRILKINILELMILIFKKQNIMFYNFRNLKKAEVSALKLFTKTMKI